VREADATIAAAVATLAREPERTAILCDFDGSLAAIVVRPEAAAPVPGAREVLARLCGRFARVGVVSGRPVEFLREQLPIEGLQLSGLYGVQRYADGEVTVDPRVTPFIPAVAAAADALSAEFGDLVERKAGLSVTAHWRAQPDLEAAITARAEALATVHRLEALHTRMAIELRPPVALDKGDAVRALAAGSAVGAFAGDDNGDLPAFAALAATVPAAVRIAVLSAEAPPALRDAVDVVVDGPAELVRLLTRVADEVG
jgi:trehalose 6-phosphate phosphatase